MDMEGCILMQMDVDGCVYGRGWMVFGLVTPLDGLVTAPVWRFSGDLLEKRATFSKIVEIASKLLMEPFKGVPSHV